jgi:hypothetical protein
MKELLIKRCSDPMRWYADKIGQRVPYIGSEGDHYEYRSIDTGGYINFVLKEDAEVVDGIQELNH